MAWIRKVIARHPVATAAVVVALLVVAGWRAQQRAARPSQVAEQLRRAPVLSAPAPPAQTGTSASGKPVPGPITSGAGGRTSPSAAHPSPPPVKSGPGGGGAGRGGGQPRLPLAPETPVPAGAPVAGPSAPAYRLAGIAGIIGDAVTLAIVEDGTGSHIVEKGDMLRPGVRVVAIDIERAVVELMQNGAAVELRLLRLASR